MVFQPNQQPRRGSNASQFSSAPSQGYSRASFDAAAVHGEVPRQRQGSHIPHEAGQYGPIPQLQYSAKLPPHQYSGMPHAQPRALAYSSTSSQQSGSPPAQSQHLVPYTASQALYQPQPQAYYSPWQYNEDPRWRSPDSSTSSHRSYRTRRSSYPKSSRRHEKDRRRKSGRDESPRPSFGATLMLLFNAFKGAFDRRR